MGTIRSNIAATLKSEDTEETFDIYFYRPVGYFIAVFSRKIGLTPNPITIISIIFGMLAGHLFYYQDFNLNLLGIAFLILANSLDSADGQLARMTNNCTKLGRFLDGFAGNLWFVSIYIHLALRMMNEGQPWTIFLLVVLIGVFHSMQAAMADFYRTQHLFFIGKNKLSDLENLDEMKRNYKQVQWTQQPFKKLYMRLFLNYVNQQQMVARNYQRFFSSLISKYGESIPQAIKDNFRALSKPLMKYTNILTTNTRFLALFAALLLNNIWIYFIFELTVLNILLIYMVWRHEKLSKQLFYREFLA
jgi:phosphatidylglycerophosphate synthase